MRNRNAALLLMVLGSIAPGAARAGITAEDFNAYLSLTSDYVFRGVSQSDGHAAIQGGFDVASNLGLYAGIWASSVDIPSFDPEAEPRTLELDYFIGYRFNLGPDWSAEALAIRYTYPGTTVHYDYSEIALSVEYGDLVSGAVSYSDDALGLGIRGVSYDLTALYSLSRTVAIQAGVGYYALDAPWIESYIYWDVGVSKSIRGFTLSLHYIDTDAAASRFFGTRAASRLALTLSAAMR